MNIEPRRGIAGAWDRFVGPGATLGENLGTLLIAVLAAAAAGLDASLRLDGSWLQVAVSAALAFDVIAGVWANATPAARRWYHREGQGPSKIIGFSAVHVHPFLLVWVWDQSWVWAAVVYLSILLSTAALHALPMRLRLAAGLVLSVCVVWGAAAIEPAMLAWFVPAMALKLVVAHGVSDGRDKPRSIP